MKLTVLFDVEPLEKTEFKPGLRGFLATEENSLVIIGEDDTHVWTILDKDGSYYGVFKRPGNLAGLHVAGKGEGAQG